MEHYPEEFLEKMKKLLSMPEYEQFLSDCEKPPYRGIRINTLKCGIEKAKKHLPFMGERTPFSDKSFYIPNEISGVGEEPFHHAGAFYVQEPSAASAVTVLDVQKGDLVLDLCAAPGGKSTQIAAELEGSCRTIERPVVYAVVVTVNLCERECNVLVNIAELCIL